MSNQKKFTVAVVGAASAVGSQILLLLDQRNFPIERLKLSFSPFIGCKLGMNNFKGDIRSGLWESCNSDGHSFR